MALLQPFTIELRKKQLYPNGGAYYPFVTTFDKAIQPSFTQTLGSADQLTFNLQMSDPKIAYLADDQQSGLEVWFYGRDLKLKQIFVISEIELSRDYGASSMGSGSGGLGSGSGDTVLITCTGLENYLTRYVISNYKVTQRNPYDILMDITAEPMSDAVLTGCHIDDPMNDSPIDIDLSWENVSTAVENIIAQIGGYMNVTFLPEPKQAQRTLNILNLPGDISQPQNVGMTSAVMPQ